VPFFLEELHDFSFILKGVVLIAVLVLAPAGIADVIAKPFRARRRRLLDETKGPAQTVKAEGAQ
jgi:branched-chain amino acid transport system permease protein